MKKPSATPEWVTRFMEEVYPGGAELALSMFDERTVLTDAATAIRDSRRERDRLRELLMDAVPCSSLTGDARKAWCSSVNQACDAHRATLSEREDR